MTPSVGNGIHSLSDAERFAHTACWAQRLVAASAGSSVAA